MTRTLTDLLDRFGCIQSSVLSMLFPLRLFRLVLLTLNHLLICYVRLLSLTSACSIVEEALSRKRNGRFQTVSRCPVWLVFLRGHHEHRWSEVDTWNLSNNNVIFVCLNKHFISCCCCLRKYLQKNPSTFFVRLTIHSLWVYYSSIYFHLQNSACDFVYRRERICGLIRFSALIMLGHWLIIKYIRYK